MRKGTIVINGTGYPVVFSIGVQIALEEQKIDLKRVTATVSSTMHLLYEMMRSGHKWAIKNGETAPDVPEFDDLIESMDPDDMMDIVQRLVPIMTGERNVTSKPAKK